MFNQKICKNNWKLREIKNIQFQLQPKFDQMSLIFLKNELMVFKIILCVKEGGVKRWKDAFISLLGGVMIVVVKSNCFHITIFYEY